MPSWQIILIGFVVGVCLLIFGAMLIVNHSLSTNLPCLDEQEPSVEIAP